MTMWKESYRLGVEKIDAQHKKLFETAEKLVQEIEGAQRPEVYRQTIAFLKLYAVTHFRDEEQYFVSIGYPEEEAHKRQHQALSQEVAKYDAALKETAYSLQTAKKLAGMLSAWLVYHVVNEDIKYTRPQAQTAQKAQPSCMAYFADSAAQVLETMVGLRRDEVSQSSLAEGDDPADVHIEIGLVGSLSGRVVFGFTQDFSCQLVSAMMSFVPNEMDELVYSMLSEISNIAAGNGTIAIAQNGTACDICPPRILETGFVCCPGDEQVQLTTQLGKMSISVHLD